MPFSKDPDLALCEMQHELDERGTRLPASARATVPYKFMTMYVTKE